MTFAGKQEENEPSQTAWRAEGRFLARLRVKTHKFEQCLPRRLLVQRFAPALFDWKFAEITAKHFHLPDASQSANPHVGVFGFK